MWMCSFQLLCSEQKDRKAGQTDAIHLSLQTVLIQAHNGVLCLAGKCLNPGGSQKQIVDLIVENRLGPIHCPAKGFVQNRRMVCTYRFVAAEYSRRLPPPLPLLSTPEVFLSLLRAKRGSR
jgi:hypothetical protein